MAKSINGIVKLISLGGFIGEVAEEKLNELYPESITYLAMQQVGIESGMFFQVCEAIADANKHAALYEGDEDDFESIFDHEWDEEFHKWFMTQSARVCVDMLMGKKEPEPELEEKTKRRMRKLNPLEREICLKWGACEDGGLLNAHEIATQEVYSCPDEYIERVINRIVDVLTMNRCTVEEFEEMYRQKNGQVTDNN